MLPPVSEERGAAVVEAGGAGDGTAGLVPGSTFAGRFLLEAGIGQGGMGVVFRARDQLVGEVVALKVLLRPSGATAELATELFRREVRLARRVTHPHVVRIHDLGEHAGCLYLTMELVAGHDLRRELPGGRVLSALRVCSLGAAIASGLEAAHAAGVVHRDLKPENILLGDGGRVLVSDFGIARAVGREGEALTGGFVGTPHYVAPEQLEGGLPGPEVDVYALGLVLYEALVGDFAFEGATPFATAIARL
jgi:serine/threonine-protein kinase